jgi:hypothetical protein
MEWCTFILRDKGREMCPIDCTNAVPEVGIKVVVVQDGLMKLCTLSWELHICTIDLL